MSLVGNGFFAAVIADSQRPVAQGGAVASELWAPPADTQAAASIAPASLTRSQQLLGGAPIGSPHVASADEHAAPLPASAGTAHDAVGARSVRVAAGPIDVALGTGSVSATPQAEAAPVVVAQSLETPSSPAQATAAALAGAAPDFATSPAAHGAMPGALEARTERQSSASAGAVPRVANTPEERQPAAGADERAASARASTLSTPAPTQLVDAVAGRVYVAEVGHASPRVFAALRSDHQASAESVGAAPSVGPQPTHGPAATHAERPRTTRSAGDPVVAAAGAAAGEGVLDVTVTAGAERAAAAGDASAPALRAQAVALEAARSTRSASASRELVAAAASELRAGEAARTDTPRQTHTGEAARVMHRAPQVSRPPPIVRIGQIDIVVEAPTPEPSTEPSPAAHAGPSGVWSRRYLRGL